MTISKQKKCFEDQRLWDKMRAGDNQALSVLFKRYYPFLFDYGMKLSAQTELVRDSIQELFAYIWDKRKYISNVDSVAAYLAVSMRRQVFKSLKRQNLRQAKYKEFSQDHTSKSFSAEEMLIMNEENVIRQKRIKKAFNQIPPRIREVLYLKTYCKLSYKEIAEVMNISPQVVRNYTSEAFHRLRVIFSKMDSIY